MPTRLGMTIPMVEVRTPLPLASLAGCCSATAPDGTGRYNYHLFTITAITAQFWKEDTWYDTWERLADPTLAATDLITTAASMVVDGTDGRVFLFSSRNNPAGPNYHRLQVYTPGTDVWAQLAGAGGTLEALIPAVAWASDARLCHPCTSAGSPASDDYIYLVGNADARGYNYRISTDTWAINAGANRGAVCGTGVSLDWLPQTPTVIYSFRGNASGLCDVYTIATGAFAAGIAMLPTVTAVWTVGVETTADARRNKLVVQIGGRFFEVGPVTATNLTLTPLGQMFQGDGTAHIGNGITVNRVGNQQYIYYRKHTGSDYHRLGILE